MMNTQVRGLNPKSRTATKAQRRARANFIRFIYYLSLSAIVGASLLKLVLAGYNAVAVASVENIVMNVSLTGLCMYFMSKALHFVEKI